MDLRKTCKLLKQFLPTDKQSLFQESYEIMIDAVNDMDVVSVFLSVINVLTSLSGGDLKLSLKKCIFSQRIVFLVDFG